MIFLFYIYLLHTINESSCANWCQKAPIFFVQCLLCDDLSKTCPGWFSCDRFFGRAAVQQTHGLKNEVFWQDFGKFVPVPPVDDCLSRLYYSLLFSAVVFFVTIAIMPSNPKISIWKYFLPPCRPRYMYTSGIWIPDILLSVDNMLKAKALMPDWF